MRRYPRAREIESICLARCGQLVEQILELTDNRRTRREWLADPRCLDGEEVLGGLRRRGRRLGNPDGTQWKGEHSR